MMRTFTAMMTALVLVVAGATSARAQDAAYGCETGDIGYNVQRAVGTGTFIDPQFVIVSFDGSEVVPPEDRDPPFVLPQVAPGRYEGPEGAFSLFDLTLSVGEGRFDCSGLGTRTGFGAASRTEPRAAPVDNAGFGPGSVADPGRGDVATLRMPGTSFGGSLRARPGVDTGRVGSLAEGTPVLVVANSGVWWNGYYWFEVIAPDAPGGETSFQWGGILCVEGDRVPGAFPCP